MTFTFRERPDSGGLTSNPPSMTLRYVAAGSADRAFVHGYALSNTLPTITTPQGTLFRQDVAIDAEGFNVYGVTVPYAKRKYETGQFRFSSSSMGGTFHIKTSRSTVNRYVAAGEAFDHEQMIGVNGDQVDGTDIVIPVMKLTCHFKHPMAVFTLPYAFYLADLTGSVNSDTFLGRPPGTILFLGHDGSDGTDAEAEVSYHFAYEKNLTGLIIGAISSIAKDGHDYLWVEWQDKEAGGKPGKKPKQVNIERVYDRIAMATAFGFGA